MARSVPPAFLANRFKSKGSNDLHGKLNAAARKKLKRSQFAIPATRSYPIPDIAHARNALARVAQFGTPAEQAQVRAAVYKKFPQLAKS